MTRRCNGHREPSRHARSGAASASSFGRGSRSSAADHRRVASRGRSSRSGSPRSSQDRDLTGLEESSYNAYYTINGNKNRKIQGGSLKSEVMTRRAGGPKAENGRSVISVQNAAYNRARDIS